MLNFFTLSISENTVISPFIMIFLTTTTTKINNVFHFINFLLLFTMSVYLSWKNLDDFCMFYD